MQHYQTEQRTLGNIVSAYPRSPADNQASVNDYLEDMLSQGFEFVASACDANGNFWIFRVAAK